jgi:hypothetical protein
MTIASNVDRVWLLAAIMMCVPQIVFSQESESTKPAGETGQDKIVNDFIRFDIGQIRDPVAIQQIKNRFARLKGDDAVPALVRGLNASTQMRASCPITALSSKLRAVVNASRDPEVGTYVLQHLNRDDAGPYTHYVNSVFDAAETQVVRTMRNGLANRRFRQRSGEGLQRLASTPGLKVADIADRELGGSASEARSDRRKSGKGQSAPSDKGTDALADAAIDWSKMTVDELAERLTDRASQVRVLTELSRRAVAGQEKSVLGVSDQIAQCLEADDDIARESAARLLGLIRCHAAIEPLIEAVDDPNARVRSAASMSLTRITRQLFGPSDDATREECQIAISRWRQWWARQSKDHTAKQPGTGSG